MRQSFTISMIALIFITLGSGGGAPGGGLPGSAASPFSGSVSTAFTAGLSHIEGKYRFTQNNYLLESALAGRVRTAGTRIACHEADAPP
jgi:hypothetical protein